MDSGTLVNMEMNNNSIRTTLPEQPKEDNSSTSLLDCGTVDNTITSTMEVSSQALVDSAICPSMDAAHDLVTAGPCFDTSVILDDVSDDPLAFSTNIVEVIYDGVASTIMGNTVQSEPISYGV